MHWRAHRSNRRVFRHRQQSEATQTRGLQLRLSLGCFAVARNDCRGAITGRVSSPLVRHQMRRVVAGSNSTALSRLNAKTWLWPIRTSVSARMRAVTSLPAIEVTTNVSEPAGSTMSTCESNLARLRELRSALSTSLTASGRIPNMTFAPSASLPGSALVGAANTMGSEPARSITIDAAPLALETLPDGAASIVIDRAGSEPIVFAAP